MVMPFSAAGEHVPAATAREPDLDLVDWPAAVDALTETVIAADTDGRILYLNAAGERLLGWTRAELIGSPLTDLIPERFRARHRQGFHNFAQSGIGYLLGRPLRVPALRKDGTETPAELVISRMRVADLTVVVGLLRDVSDRVEVEGPGELSDRIVASLAESATLDDAWPRVLRALVEELNWDLAQLWLHDPAEDTLARTAVWARPPGGYAGFLRASDCTFGRGEGLPGQVWETAAPAWLTRVHSEANFPRVDAAEADGLRCGFAFPLRAGPRLLGVIELYSVYRRDENPVLAQRLTALGRELGWFLDRRSNEEQRLALLDAEREAREAAERAQERLEAVLARTADLASTLQRSLLPPRMPDIPGVALGARYLPAGQGTEVGGDFYDVFRLTGGSWGVVIGDVCGKGVEAATVTAFARYTIRAAAMQVTSPSKALAMLNDAMLAHAADGGPDLFATAALLRLRAQPGGLRPTLACAGHPLPLVQRSSGEVATVGRTGTLLGVFDRFATRDAQISLLPGDHLVLVTDGVLEARRHGEQWGEEGLAALLRQLVGSSPQQIADAVVAAALDYQGGTARDDIAVIVVAPRS